MQAVDHLYIVAARPWPAIDCRDAARVDLDNLQLSRSAVIAQRAGLFIDEMIEPGPQAAQADHDGNGGRQNDRKVSPLPVNRRQPGICQTR